MDERQNGESNGVYSLGDDDRLRVLGDDVRFGAVLLWRRYAAVACWLDRLFDKKQSWGVEIDGLTLRRPRVRDDGWLLVVRGKRGSERLVTFHRGTGGADCLEGFGVRLKAGDVSWRIDQDDRASGASATDTGRSSLPPIEGL